jgi:hypothetical protein
LILVAVCANASHYLARAQTALWFVSSSIILIFSLRGEELLIALPTPLMLAQSEASVYNLPSYFTPVFMALLILGALGWLVAAVLGFARARAFGASTRWFSLAALSLLAYHLQWAVLVFTITLNDSKIIFLVLATLNLFVVLGAVFTIIGFTRLTAAPS